ncbi:MAG: CelD/BcsL family acetyltransferase involved in cellulose biosynthesis [Motiliproteus sp.]|jgi:CelD/BcsL family acetyltransferase involved in cellulose biosynthesis
MYSKDVSWKLLPVTRFKDHKDTWDRLNQAGSSSALLSSRFIEPCLSAFSNGSETFAIATRGDSVLTMAILERVGFGRWQTVQPSQAPIGFWLGGTETKAIALLESLSQALPGWVLSISITQQDPAILPRPEQSAQVTTLDYITTGRMDIPADFEAYWQSRGKNVRQNINKSKNRLEREGVDITFDIVKDSSAISDYIAGFGELESAGWKQNTGTAVHVDNKQGRFYIDLLQRFMPDDSQVWRYCFNGKLAATDLCISEGGVLYILKTTYDENWKRYSPAFMMHLEGVRLCSEQDIQAIEFYGPAMEWHKKLTKELRTLYHITWFSHPLIPKTKRLKQRLLGGC